MARNLTEHEDAHSREMQGILTAPGSPAGPGPLRLAGGVGAGGVHRTGRRSEEGPDLAAAGAAVGGGPFPVAAGPSGAVDARGARPARPVGPGAPDRHTVPAERATAVPAAQPRPASAAGPHPASGHQGGPVPARNGTGGHVGGQSAREPAGPARPAFAPPAGAPDPGAYGRPGLGRHQGQEPGQGGAVPAREGAAAPRGPRAGGPAGDPAGPGEGPAEVADDGDRVAVGRQGGVYGA
ncbi:hypothetical protein [Kitasatospora sp. NPDC088346]|uniref:hypothetical protein n=1 Tax=Kitasatospora sp. NPDC088346 TaxID=3364073 RepID=UPI00382D1E17